MSVCSRYAKNWDWRWECTETMHSCAVGGTGVSKMLRGLREGVTVRTEEAGDFGRGVMVRMEKAGDFGRGLRTVATEGVEPMELMLDTEERFEGGVGTASRLPVSGR